LGGLPTELRLGQMGATLGMALAMLLVGDVIGAGPIARHSEPWLTALGRSETVRLTQMWFEQAYLNRTVSWRWGRMSVGGEFATFPCDFQNLTFCEVAWQPKFLNDWLAGSYKLGASYSSGQQPDAVYDGPGNLFALSGQPPATRQGLYGAYVGFQQQITRGSIEHPNRGLRILFNAAFAGTVPATTDRQIAAGFWYTGPLEVRPNDVIAFAVGTIHQNQRLTEAASLQNALGLGPVAVKDSEYLFELDYSFGTTPGLLIRPNAQYINSPGGSSVTKDVSVLGLKTIISF
jgi:porin